MIVTATLDTQPRKPVSVTYRTGLGIPIADFPINTICLHEQFDTDLLPSGFHMQVAQSTLLEGKMIHLNEQTGAFEPETLNILSGAMDEAWRRVKLTHLNGSANAARTVLAEHILAMARQGERDPQRLIEGALIRFTL